MLLLMLAALAGLVATLVLRAVLGLSWIARSVVLMRALCEGVLSRCLGYAAFWRVSLAWAGAFILLGGLVLAAVRASLSVLRTRRALARLPVGRRRGPLVLIDDSSLALAFTHGLLRPRVYITRGLIRTLERDELRAVILHEMAHREACDPLRFFLLSILGDLLFFVPAVSELASAMRQRQERLADDLAAAAMREPFSIASALVKLAGRPSTRLADSAPILGRRGREVEDRVRRLMGEGGRGGAEEKAALIRRGRPGQRWWQGSWPRALLANAALPLFVLISLSMPVRQGLPMKMGCTMGHCLSRKPRPEKNCRIHCDKTTRITRPTPLKPLH